MKDKFLIVTCETKIDFKEYDETYFIIGVERGCLDLIKKNICIDLAVSDFDQINAEELKLIQSYAKEIEILKFEKDLLDGTVALETAYKLGAKEIVFIAKPTARIDMNLSIIELCCKYRAVLLNDNSLAYCLTVGKNKIDYQQFLNYKFITLFPITPTIVSISGLKYEVLNLKLSQFSTRAFSNCFNKKNATITTDQPIMIIFNK